MNVLHTEASPADDQRVEEQWSIANTDGNLIFDRINVTSAQRSRMRMMASRAHISVSQGHALDECAVKVAKNQIGTK